MKNDGLYRVLVRAGVAKDDGFSTLYVKDVIDVIRKQV